MQFAEKQVETETKYVGRIVNVRMDCVELHTGKRVPREIVEHPGGVAIVPVDGDGNVTMVRQFRYAFGRDLLEIPAGKLEVGEDPLECAKRELSEETGYEAGKIIDLGMNYPSPGFCDEILHIYLALDLKAGKIHLDEDEFLNVEVVHIDEIVKRIMKNEICDGKTVAGILKAKIYLN